jgi:Ca2+ transporting ATPase
LKRKPYGRHDFIICSTMWRHIIGIAVYETVVVFLCMFLWGEDAEMNLVQDREYRCTLLADGDLVECSTVFWPEGLCKRFLLSRDVAVFSEAHFSFIFNVFIYLQIFNWLNSRRCYNEVNFFDRIQHNILFVVVWIVAFLLQVVIMLVPGLMSAFRIFYLPVALWGFAFAFSFFVLPLKFLFLLFKLPDPFNGEIPFREVEGVPAGVYKFGEPFPAGCIIHNPGVP